MKIVIAPDKFKGSLTGIEFCDIVENGIKKYHPDSEIINLPLADGGDGTVEALQYYLGGEFITTTVHDPLMRMVEASYLYSKNTKVAFIEMAEASGLRLLNRKEKNPLHTSTFGTGELIFDAIRKGAQQIILGIGGSATNDAGLGMARALGFRFYDSANNELMGSGKDLNALVSIYDENVLPELKTINFKVACDVENPLYGKNGAAYIYGPQKGANLKIVTALDLGLQQFNRVAKEKYNTDIQKLKGAGAAGGLGAGATLFLNAELKSGISLIKQTADFKNKIQGADWIITGEGKIDDQTFTGKVIQGITQEISDQKIAVFCGINQVSKDVLKNHQISYIDELLLYAENVNDSIINAKKYLKTLVEVFAKKMIR